MTQAPKTNFLRTGAHALAVMLLALVGQGVVAQDDQGQGSMASRMILELQQMREEVRELRGLVEAQAQEIENLKRRQRDQYVDLDRRLGQLRGRSGQPSPEQLANDGTGSETGDTDRPAGIDESGSSSDDRADDESASGAQQGAGDGQPRTGRIAPPEVRDPLDEQPEVTTLDDQGSGDERALREPTETERQAYDEAFRALRETRYADAAEGFDAFLREHPDSAYAPNALYWLGEVYYVTRDFETALAQFERLQDTYPDSSKQPDALLKIGFSHYELGNWDRARAALEQVIADYPGTNYARLAENRLRTMRLEGNL